MFKYPSKSRFIISSCEIFKHTFTRRKESLPVNIFLPSHACSAPMWTASPTWNSTEHKPSNSTWRKPSWLHLPMLSFSGFFVDQRSKRKNLWTWWLLHSPFKATYIWSSKYTNSCPKAQIHSSNKPFFPPLFLLFPVFNSFITSFSFLLQAIICYKTSN